MQLTENFKHTPIGYVPSDWQVRKLGELGTVIRGSSPRPKGDKRYYGGEVPRLMVEDVTRDGKIVTPSVDFLTAAGAKMSRPCKKGTLTIVCSGTVGIPSFLGVDACIHDGFLALVGITIGVSDDYLYHQLVRLRDTFDSSATHGGIFTNLTTSGVREFIVPLPPTKAEQEAIAGALSDADRLIESLERLVAKKRQLRQAAMQELLTGNKRLPGFTAKWERHTFGELFCFLRTANNSRSELTSDGELAYVHYGDIHTHSSAFLNFAKKAQSCIPREKVKTVPRLQVGDLLMADASEDTIAIGKAVEVQGLNGREAVGGLHTMLLRADKDVLADGFKGYLQYFPSVRDALVRLATGVSVYGVTKSGVKAIEINIPKSNEQTAIACILADMDAEITALEAKLNKARQIKQGMMHNLLTGRVRLV